MPGHGCLNTCVKESEGQTQTSPIRSFEESSSPGILRWAPPAPPPTRSGRPAPLQKMGRSAGRTEALRLTVAWLETLQINDRKRTLDSPQSQASWAWLQVEESGRVPPERKQNMQCECCHVGVCPAGGTLQNDVSCFDVLGEAVGRPRTVSVCQKVSTIGHLFSPTTVKYHCQASGLMGSPTVPRTFRDSRLYLHTRRLLL